MRDVIQVEQLWKQYRLGMMGTGAFLEDMRRMVGRISGRGDSRADLGEENDREAAGTSGYVWALRDINFSLKQGEVLGIIGRNGAGKSTLLKILSQVSHPTRGSIKIKGRMASLLEVGTGFNPDLSGRENIFLNGTILGMTRKEINSKFEQIVEFSGVQKYIDTPVKRYSSGMKVRLGFAVAAHLEPDILVVDEVLAVGDAEFQTKCIGKMQDVAGSGRTVLFVSHNLSAVRNLCNRGIVIDKGTMTFDGSSGDAINFYRRMTQVHGDERTVAVFNETINEPFQFLRAEIVNASGEPTGRFEFHDGAFIKASIRIHEPRPDSMVGIIIEDTSGNLLIVSTNDENNGTFLGGLAPGDYTVMIGLPSGILKPGEYWITLAARGKMDKAYHRPENCLSFEITDTVTYRGMKNLYRKQAIIAPEISWRLIP